MTATVGFFCQSNRGLPKETFRSEQAAKRALSSKRRFKARRYPHVFRCPSCSRFHLTSSTS